MCGIAGISAYRPSARGVDEAELTRIRDHMASRGPEGARNWMSADGRVGLGHRRLSFIDLSEGGAQPKLSADGALALTFNGEIYNYQALRAGLQAKGHVFQTESDSEVILHLYAEKGAAMVEDLRGMFAFALWDARRGGLLLARDPYGIKPLYYADDGGTFRFASQVKALLAGGSVSRDPEAAGWVGFHLFGSVPEPFTTYRAIRALPAGSTMWVDAGGAQAPQVYFSPAQVYADGERQPLRLSPGDLQAYLREALFDSVRHHMVADVPVGIFLSAGIDSGALLGLMHDVGHGSVETVTLAYEEFQQRHDDEAPLAAVCAAHYGSRHTVRVVTEGEFDADLPALFEAMDQPTIDGVNTWFVSKAAKELGLKAAISGVGGDELFGGYPAFSTVPRSVRTWALPAKTHLGDAFRMFAERSGLSSVVNPKVAGLVKYGGTFPGAYFLQRGLFMPWELDRLMDPGMVAEGLARLDPVGHVARALEPEPRGDFAKVAALEASLYMRNQLLRDADWASMAHSLEVRTPLVDATLLKAVAPVGAALAEGVGKAALAASPKKPLPREIAERAKTGFTTPVNEWLQRRPQLQAWRETPMLARGNCPWARRWAYQLAAA
ncbi:MAG: asparagine synthase (glutamine-hydrolyzing) [Phenylobacterium sp.]